MAYSCILRLTRRNTCLNGVDHIRIELSHGFENVPDKDFDVIMSNPPYHTDFSVAKRFIEGAFAHLILGGRLIMVTKRRQWYENKIKSVFGGVRVIESG
ncbi:MAG TPA: methyltransferase [Firmicutes bacterium]|nr:methyltransferase [Bacillota bacterium]HHY97364.1 methyltransferase [Bacillota bacterium]